MAKPIRERIREDLDPIYARFIEKAPELIDAKKLAWMNCPHCKKKSQVEVDDAKAALALAEFMVNQGFGRPGQAESEVDTSIVFENKVVLVAED